MNCKKCINLIESFYCEVLKGELDLLIEYPFVRESYKKIPDNININFEKLDYYYKSNNCLERKEYIEDKNGNCEETQIPYAIYSLLYKNKNIKLKCNHNESGKIIALIDINNTKYMGYKINTLCITNKEIYSYCTNNKTVNDKLIHDLEKIKIECETLGNFMPMPKEIKKILCGEQIQNQFDLFLEQVQSFYKNNYEYKNKNYITKEIYFDLKRNENYFKLFGDFKNFIKSNYLEHYLDKVGNVKELFERKKGQILPETVEELQMYLRRIHLIISYRAAKIREDLLNVFTKEKIPIILDKIKNTEESKLESEKILKKIAEEHYDIIRNLSIFWGNIYIYTIKNNEELLKYKKEIIECVNKSEILTYASWEWDFRVDGTNYYRNTFIDEIHRAFDNLTEYDLRDSLQNIAWGFKEEYKYIFIIGCKN